EKRRRRLRVEAPLEACVGEQGDHLRRERETITVGDPVHVATPEAVVPEHQPTGARVPEGAAAPTGEPAPSSDARPHLTAHAVPRPRSPRGGRLGGGRPEMPVPPSPRRGRVPRVRAPPASPVRSRRRPGGARIPPRGVPPSRGRA